MSAAMILGFVLGIVATFAFSIILLGVFVMLAGRNAPSKPPLRMEAVRRLSRDVDAPPNMALIAHLRQRHPVFHEEPSGQIVELIGVEDMHGLWPEDV